MKHILTVLASTIPALVFSATATSGNAFIGNADVIEAHPLYETVEVTRPVTECWTESVTRNNRRASDYIAPIAGGIVGGVVGHQFGKGRGKSALTVVGTLLGATVGHEVSGSHARRPARVEHVQRCETVNRHEEQQQLAGYRVKYRYEGQTYYTQTTDHPGKHIPVRVNVHPLNGI